MVLNVLQKRHHYELQGDFVHLCTPHKKALGEYQCTALFVVYPGNRAPR